MTHKKKLIIIIISLLLFVLITSIWLFVLFTSDISDEKLGPSPFKVEEGFTSDNNLEYHEIVNIGNAIIGAIDFGKKYQLDLNNPDQSIELLHVYLQKNQKQLDKNKPELYKNFKFPKLNSVNFNFGMVSIRRISDLAQNKVVFEILTNDIENATKDLIIINQNNQELLNKSNYLINFMIIFAIKSSELKTTSIFINHKNTSLEQKLNILSINRELISVQILRTIAHFEEEFLRDSIRETKKAPSIITDNYFTKFIEPYAFQPNRTLKLQRNILTQIFIEVEKPTFNINTDLTTIIPKATFDVSSFSRNSLGIKALSGTIETHSMVIMKALEINNKCNQLLVARHLLLYQTKTGSFPAKLEDLQLSTKLITDIYTEKPFLYSFENGILQSIGNDKINNNIDLTTKILTTQEIRKILNNKKYGDDFILYLK